MERLSSEPCAPVMWTEGGDLGSLQVDTFIADCGRRNFTMKVIVLALTRILLKSTVR